MYVTAGARESVHVYNFPFIASWKKMNRYYNAQFLRNLVMEPAILTVFPALF